MSTILAITCACSRGDFSMSCAIALVSRQIDIAQLAVESRTRAQGFSEAVVLIKIDDMEDIPRHLMSLGTVEIDNQIDRDVRPVERIGKLDRRVGAERMPIKPRCPCVRARSRRRCVAPPLASRWCLDARAIALAIELVGQRVHAARKNVGKPRTDRPEPVPRSAPAAWRFARAPARRLMSRRQAERAANDRGGKQSAR